MIGGAAKRPAGLFVTGTDTGIGKTLVSCAILRALARRGHRLGVYKPAETGCAEGPDGALRGDDCERLAAAANAQQPIGRVSSALYPVPAAPLVAAEAAGETIEPDALLRDFGALADEYAAVLVEGAGGLLVPVSPGFTYADLAARLGLPALVVVGSKLGCLNHALLTLAELEHRGLPVAGTVINEVEAAPAETHAVATHRETLARFTKAPDLGVMPYLDAAEREDCDRLAAHAERALDVDALARAMALQ